MRGSGVEVTRMDRPDGDFSIKFSNSYKDKTTGEYKSTDFFSAVDVAVARQLIDVALNAPLQVQAEKAADKIAASRAARAA
jgi:hypothetical protein